MSDLYDFFKEIEKKPGMYVSSIFELYAAICGYGLARGLNAPSTDRENDFWDNFHNWLQERLDARTNKSWASIILFRSYNERDALERFFPLLEEFKSRNAKSESKKEIDRLEHNLDTKNGNSEETSDLYDLLKKMEKRPAMYVGGQSILLLESFINGYLWTRSELNIPSTQRENDFLNDFHSWLQERLDARTTRKSWASIILFRSFSERDALKNFFPLLEEFKNRNENSESEEEIDNLENSLVG